MTCPPSHKHAENSTCYMNHRCRCAECLAHQKARRAKKPKKRHIEYVTCYRCGMTSVLIGSVRTPIYWCRDCQLTDREWFNRVEEAVA